jgi:hypothetical protein
MSKYENLCTSHSLACKEYFDYMNECHRFAYDLMNELISYLNIPKERIEYIPTKKEIEENKEYNVIGSMHLDKDTFFHFGVIITFQSSIPLPLTKRFLYKVMLKKEEDRFRLKYNNPESDGFLIDPSDKDSSIVFFEYLYKEMKNYIENGFQRFLNQQDDGKFKDELEIIGFSNTLKKQ